MKTIAIQNCGMDKDSFAILMHTAHRVLSLRALACTEGEGEYTVTLAVDPTLQNDRFVIRAAKNGAALSAANDTALHAAFGRLLRESKFDGRGGFVPPKTDTVIDFTPKSLLRGMYFATHFGNFYHHAPIESVYEVVEDLALNGCNSLLVWFDMHHFTSMQDPNAQSLVKRLHAILRYANAIGMGGSLTMLANESFADSPEHLRASWRVQNGYHDPLVGHFHIEICPSSEEGIAEILRMRREMLSYFSDLRIDYVVYWPYDQGGCTCKKCAPWGANGFLKLLPHFRTLVKEMMPDAELVISTWFLDRFTDGEWDGFYQAMKSGLFSDVRYVLSFFEKGVLPKCIAEEGVPEGIEFIDFPEISMYSCMPWGGYGASHLAAFLDETNRNSGHLYRGGFPYSEGIFEDANKFISLMYYSGEYENAFDALRAYVRNEFCCDDEALYEAIKRTETGLARDRKEGDYTRAVILDPSDTEFVYDMLSYYRELLPERIANSSSFRLYYLRAVIDYEMARCDGYPARSERCKAAMQELCEIYCATNETHRWVRPFIGPWWNGEETEG